MQYAGKMEELSMLVVRHSACVLRISRNTIHVLVGFKCGLWWWGVEKKHVILQSPMVDSTIGCTRCKRRLMRWYKLSFLIRCAPSISLCFVFYYTDLRLLPGSHPTSQKISGICVVQPMHTILTGRPRFDNFDVRPGQLWMVYFRSRLLIVGMIICYLMNMNINIWM